MPHRNSGWRWHLASSPDTTAWQLEVNKSWGWERAFPPPSLLAPPLLLSALRQTPKTCCFPSFSHSAGLRVYPPPASARTAATNTIRLSQNLRQTPRRLARKEDERACQMNKSKHTVLGDERHMQAVCWFSHISSHVSFSLSLCSSPQVGVVTKKAAETGTKRPQTPWSSTGKTIFLLPVSEGRCGPASWPGLAPCCCAACRAGGLTRGVFRDRVIAGELSGKCFPRDLQAVAASKELLALNSQLFHRNLLTTALLIFSVNSALPLAGFVARLRAAAEQ